MGHEKKKSYFHLYQACPLVLSVECPLLPILRETDYFFSLIDFPVSVPFMILYYHIVLPAHPSAHLAYLEGECFRI